MARLTTSIPEPMSDDVQGRVESGQFGNTSEYFRDLVRREAPRRPSATWHDPVND